MEEKEHITIAICDDETVYGERVRNECIKFLVIVKKCVVNSKLN